MIHDTIQFSYSIENKTLLSNTGTCTNVPKLVDIGVQCEILKPQKDELETEPPETFDDVQTNQKDEDFVPDMEELDESGLNTTDDNSTRCA